MEQVKGNPWEDERRYALNRTLKSLHERTFRKTPLLFFRIGLVFVMSFLVDAFLSVMTRHNRFRRGVPRRILLIKPDHVGDLVLATPVFKALKKAFPSASLSVLVGPWAQDVLAHNPHIDEVLTYYARWNDRAVLQRSRKEWVALKLANILVLKRILQKRFDLAIALKGDYGNVPLAFLASGQRLAHHDFTPYKFLLTHPVAYDGMKHEMERHQGLLAALGITSSLNAFKSLELFPSRSDEAWATRLLTEHGMEKGLLIGFHPGSGAPLNRWPVERFAEVADFLAETYQATILLVGGKEERGLAEEFSRRMRHPCLNLAGKTSILQMAALLRHCRLFVCNDGGPMHVAEAMKVPLVALFGPSPAHHFRPLAENALVLKREVPCSPCPQFVPRLRNECPENICMRLLSVRDVQHAASALLGHPSVKAVSSPKK